VSTIQCPKCGTKLKLPAGLGGTRIACPKCSSKVLIPGGLDTPSSPATGSTPVTGSTPATGSIPAPGSTLANKSSGSQEEWFSLDTSAESLGLSGMGFDAPSEEEKSQELAQDDDLKLASDQEPVAKQTAPQEQQRSVFDDDLPDLSPFDDSPSPQGASPKKKRDEDVLRSYMESSGFPPGLPPIPTSDQTPDQPTSLPAGFPAGIPAGFPAGFPADLNADFSADPFGESKQQSTQQSKQQSKGGVTSGGVEPKVDDTEYGVTCKVCGTRLYVRPSQTGKKIRCPDCFSEFPAPPPSPKKKQSETRWDQPGGSVGLASDEGDDSKAAPKNKVNTKAMLDKAAEDLEREREEYDTAHGTFDTKGWLGLIFGFTTDRSLVIAIAVLSMFAGIFGYVYHSLGPYVLDQEHWHIQFIRLLMFALGFIPIMGAVLLCALAIIPKAANQLIKVEEWPFGRLGDSFGELMMMVIAISGVYALGLPIGSALSKMGAPFLISSAIPTLTLWGFLPIVLLSMIESGSMFPPVTLSILKSVSGKSEEWGAMYMQTGVVLAILFILCQVAFVFGPITVGLLGILIPWAICFIANQYGILAGRISDVTELAFEGEFTEEE